MAVPVYAEIEATIGSWEWSVWKRESTSGLRSPSQSASRSVTLSDLDENYFVLLGGQDGWFRSSTFTSQMPLWLEGGYVQVPLRLETVRRTFKHQTTLRPKRG